MRYKDAYNYINSFTNYENVPGVNYALSMDGLMRVQLLMRMLADPQASFKSVVVAGTKGKGSVAAMIESALREAGYTTGLYTSPHLHTFRERIQVSGEMISPEDMARIVTDRLQPAVQKITGLGEPTLLPTTYESATAIAFLYFQERKVDVAVLEVGLGGRLDAVNVTRPLVSVITPISLDHTQVLGSTLAEIAEEKAGIIKEGRRVVTAPQSEEALAVIRRVAAGRRAQVDLVSQNVYVSTQHLPEVVSDERQVPVYQTFSLGYEAEGNRPRGRIRLKLPLLGSHQQINAAVALGALRALSSMGTEVDNDAIARGFANVSWPGRMEIVRTDPVVIVDGAHNVESMAKLNQAIHDLFYRRKLIAVLGISRDKDVEGIIGELGAGPGNVLGPRVEKVIVTRSRHPRAASSTQVAEAVRARGLYVETRDNVHEALATATGIAEAAAQGTEDDPIVLVTGSLFIVAEAREHFGLAPDLSEESL